MRTHLKKKLLKVLKPTGLIIVLNTGLFFAVGPAFAGEACLLFCPAQFCLFTFDQGSCTCKCKTIIIDREVGDDAEILGGRRAVETIVLGRASDGVNVTYVPTRNREKNNRKSARDRLRELSK
jgi:hypothetical protein